MKIKKILYALLFLTLSCNSKEIEPNDIEKASKTSIENLSQHNLKDGVTVYHKNDTLQFDFFDKNVPMVLNEYEDLKSKFFIYQLDSFELFEEFSYIKTNSIINQITEKDTANVIHVYNKENYIETISMFNNNELFTHFMYVLISELNYDNYMMFETIIDILDKNDPQFKFEDDFITLVYNFSLECDSDNQNSESFKLLNKMKRFCEKDVDTFHPELQTLNYFLETCDNSL